MPYLAFDPSGYEGAPPPVLDDAEEEERRRRGFPPKAIVVSPNAVPDTGATPLTAGPLTSAPVLAAPPRPLNPIKEAAGGSGEPIGPPREVPVLKEQLASEPIVPLPVASAEEPSPFDIPVADASALSSKTTAASPAPVRRPPISVMDQVGRMPDRSDPRYQYAGHGIGGRLKAGWENVKYQPSAPVSAAGGPGVMAGEGLGQILGHFLGGVIRPSAPGEAKYARDLGLWQQRQEAASKAASEEANRAREIAAATHRDPYTGEVDPYYSAMIGQKTALATHYAAQDQAASIRAQAMLGRLDETSRRDLFNALKGGVLKPTPELEKKLGALGMTYVAPVAKGQLGMLHHRGIDAYGRPVDTYYTWDKQTGFVKPMRAGDEMVGEGGPLLPNVNPPNVGTGSGEGVQRQPSVNPAAPPFELPGVPAKGAGDFGAFRTLDEMNRNFEADATAYRAYQQNYRALDQQATQLEQKAESMARSDLDRPRVETQAERARDKAIAAEKEWKTHEAAIKGKYPAGYLELGPGDGGWYYIKNHPEKMTAGYPFDKKTGKPIRGVNIGKGSAFANQ